MSDYQINNYGVNSSQSMPSTGKVKAPSTLNTTDFLQLLAAQMSNQDVMNPTDNTEFVSQMAQFSSLQAMDSLSQTATAQYSASLSSYSADLVGKRVLVARYDDSGNYVEEQGVVDSVSFGSGTYSLKINGKDYDLSSVMEVLTDSGASSYQYAASLVGKNVTVSEKDSTGKLAEVTGVVTGCSFESGNASIMINGKSYALSSVTKVLADSGATVPATDDGSGESSDPDTPAGA